MKKFLITCILTLCICSLSFSQDLYATVKFVPLSDGEHIFSTNTDESALIFVSGFALCVITEDGTTTYFMRYTDQYNDVYYRHYGTNGETVQIAFIDDCKGVVLSQNKEEFILINDDCE